MKKIILGLAALAIGVAASAQSNSLTNEVRVMSTTSAFAAVNTANGTSLSDVKSTTGGTANGNIAAPAAGVISLTGDIAGYSTLVGYNVATQGGVGSAAGRVWSDARTYGDLGTAIATGDGKIKLDVEGGFRNAGLNGSDVSLRAGTSQDGVAQALYNAGGAVSLAMSSGPAGAGVGVLGNISGGSYQHAEAATGAVTFTGGTPAGQSAALRTAQAGVQVDLSGDLFDPAK